MTPLNPLTDNRRHITRRALFGRAAAGVGTAALAYLFQQNPLLAAGSNVSSAAAGAGALAGLPHFAPKA